MSDSIKVSRSDEMYLTDLPLPSVVEWAIFPFEGDLKVRSVHHFNEEEHLRHGDPGGPPCECESDDKSREENIVWTDGVWAVTRLHFTEGQLAPFPAYMLRTVEHLDIENFDEEMGAALGVITIRLEKAIRAIGTVGRVHINRWGDGGAHFHIWFLGRPTGAWQLSGYNLPMWGFILPSLTEEDHASNDRIVAAELTAAAS